MKQITFNIGNVSSNEELQEWLNKIIADGYKITSLVKTYDSYVSGSTESLQNYIGIAEAPLVVKSYSENIKPPLGLKPKSIADLHRAEEIIEAMKRFNNAKVEVPLTWYEELLGLLNKK